MQLTNQTLPVLRTQWEADCQKLIPDFKLLDQDLMYDEIERVREVTDMHGASDLEVVVAVLRNLEEDRTEVPAAWWWITACLLIMPDMESHPWFEVVWWAYQNMRGKRQTNTLWGSASCGKTAVFAAMALTSMVVWHGDCHIYISSPAKNAGKDKIWAATIRWVELWEEKPPEWAAHLGLSFKSVTDTITVINKEGRKSTASFVSLETTAQIQGKKRVRMEGTARFIKTKGVIMLIGDEIIISPAACKKFLEGEGNIVSNNNFMGWVGMNPLPEQVRHANAMQLSAPSEVTVESLNEHVNFTWKTNLGTLYRFCMDNSPNRGDREPVFDFIINHEQAEAASKRGEDNHKAQVAAWGWADGMGNGGPASLDHINRDSHQVSPAWYQEQSRVGFFDLAFGGRDPAGYCCLEMGVALIGETPTHVLSGVDQQKMKIMRTWKPSGSEIDNFIRLAGDRGGKAPEKIRNRVQGEELGANYHMVYEVLKTAAELKIPPGRVSFDSSLRPDVTQMMVEALGRVPWYYSGSRKITEEEVGWPMWPPVMEGRVRRTWSDVHAQPVSAAWRFAEHLVARGHVHGLKYIRKGLMELISRMWIRVPSGKEDVEGKQKLAVSPWAGETFALCTEFAVRFCGALPQLSSDKPLVGSMESEIERHPVFTIQHRKVKRIW